MRELAQGKDEDGAGINEEVKRMLEDCGKSFCTISLYGMVGRNPKRKFEQLGHSLNLFFEVKLYL